MERNGLANYLNIFNLLLRALDHRPVNRVDA